VTPMVDAADRAGVTRALDEVRRWAEADLRDLSVAIVYGPVSAEDQLYLSKCPPGQLSVNALSAALDELGVRSEVLDPCRGAFIRDLTRFHVALSNLHGPFGEDGRLQGLLDYLRMPYCGSGVAASAIAADKVLCKRLMESAGIPTPRWRVWPDAEPVLPGGAVMVKPRMGGSSVGMSLVWDQATLDVAATEAQDSAGDPPGVLVEEYVPGVPVTVGMLELPGAVLVFPPLATYVRSAEFYDSDVKLDANTEGTVACERADLPRPVLDALIASSLRLWHALGCRGMARVDFIVADDGGVVALEVNTTPGLSYESNFVTAAGLCGLRHADVVTAILHEAMARRRYDAPLPLPEIS
jgi:D-alanine-D-alanine ligase